MITSKSSKLEKQQVINTRTAPGGRWAEVQCIKTNVIIYQKQRKTICNENFQDFSF